MRAISLKTRQIIEDGLLLQGFEASDSGFVRDVFGIHQEVKLSNSKVILITEIASRTITHIFNAGCVKNHFVDSNHHLQSIFDL